VPDSSLVKWNEESILTHLKLIAQEQLNLTSEQIAAIQPDAPVLDALRLDSLAQVVLMAAIEKDFACTFEPEELQQIHSVRDLVTLIVHRVSPEPGVR
jgi:acyl carrier protein